MNTVQTCHLSVFEQAPEPPGPEREPAGPGDEVGI